METGSTLVETVAKLRDIFLSEKPELIVNYKDTMANITGQQADQLTAQEVLNASHVPTIPFGYTDFRAVEGTTMVPCNFSLASKMRKAVHHYIYPVAAFVTIFRNADALIAYFGASFRTATANDIRTLAAHAALRSCVSDSTLMTMRAGGYVQDAKGGLMMVVACPVHGDERILFLPGALAKPEYADVVQSIVVVTLAQKAQDVAGREHVVKNRFVFVSIQNVAQMARFPDLKSGYDVLNELNTIHSSGTSSKVKKLMARILYEALSIVKREVPEAPDSVFEEAGGSLEATENRLQDLFDDPNAVALNLPFKRKLDEGG